VYQGLFQLGVDILKKKIIFPVYNSSYSTINYSNISYRFKSAQKVDLSNFEKGNSYVTFIIKNIKQTFPGFTPPPKRLSYIIADGYFNGLEYFGVDNYLMTSRFLRTSNTIIDVSSNGFYKHELIHYVFSNYKFCKFLNEGIATFLSGEARFGENATDILELTKDKIRNNQEFASRLNNKDSFFDASLATEMYVTAALLIRDYYKKLGEEKFYKSLFENLVILNDVEALLFLKKELKINEISDYILSVKGPIEVTSNKNTNN